MNFADGKPLLQECIGALLETITDDTLLKIVNMNILMHTRSEDPRVRIFALTCSESLWRSQGGKLIGMSNILFRFMFFFFALVLTNYFLFAIGFVAETSTFIIECGEDDNDMVVKESFKLKDAVESVAGKIDGL